MKYSSIIPLQVLSVWSHGVHPRIVKGMMQEIFAELQALNSKDQESRCHHKQNYGKVSETPIGKERRNLRSN